MSKKPLVLGVTGNISSGKSTVARALEQRGAVVVDADQLAREVVETGTKTLERLVKAFGNEILQSDGSLNRERLGQMVFADTKVRATLNQIIHPEIGRKSVEVLQKLRERGDIPLVVYEAPLLFEVGAENRVDKILVVKIDLEEQLKRLMDRNHFSKLEAQQRIAAQMPQEKKLAQADYVVDNSGSIAETLQQVEELWARLVDEK